MLNIVSYVFHKYIKIYNPLPLFAVMNTCLLLLTQVKDNGCASKAGNQSNQSVSLRNERQ